MEMSESRADVGLAHVAQSESAAPSDDNSIKYSPAKRPPPISMESPAASPLLRRQSSKDTSGAFAEEPSKLVVPSTSTPTRSGSRPRSATWRKIMPGIGTLGRSQSVAEHHGDPESSLRGPHPPSSLRGVGNRQIRTSVQSAFELGSSSSPAGKSAIEGGSTGSRDRKDALGTRKTSMSVSQETLGESVSQADGKALPRTGTTAQNFVRRVGSRSFFFKGSSGGNQAAAASTDSLATSADSSISVSKRASDMLSRTTSMPSWARRRSKTSLTSAPGPRSPSLRSPDGRTSIDTQASASVASLLDFGRAAGERVVDNSVADNEAHPDQVCASSSGTSAPGRPSLADDGLHAAQGEAFPRRLSGWLLNMLGTEEQVAERDQATQPLASTSASSTALKRPPSDHSERSVSPSLQRANSRSSVNGSAARKQSILSNLSNTARQRVGNLDRAMRSLREAENDASTRDIWLLGVLHSSVAGQDTFTPGEKLESQSPRDSPRPTSPARRPTIEVHTASPRQARAERASSPAASNTEHRTEAEAAAHEDKRGPGEPSSVSKDSLLLPASSDSADRAPRTPSPVERRLAGGDETLIIRNPPTPHASPQPPSAPRETTKRRNSADEKPGLHRKTSVGTALNGSARMTPPPDLAAFHDDLSSRVWCTYRANFSAIARDGSISAQAADAARELAATQAAEALSTAQAEEGAALESTATSMTASVSVPLKSQHPSHLHTTSLVTGVATPSAVEASRTSRGWLGRRPAVSSAGYASELASTSPPGASPGLGAALGLPRASSASPSSGQPFQVGSAPGLGERMGIPSLWGRTTAALSGALGVRSDLTRDSGWGCMLRTGQSLLANALINVHLGRDWRRRTRPSSAALAKSLAAMEAKEAWRVSRAEYATYVRLLSWFFDDPSPACPFSVHRMAREGKRLGKEPGEWFGPSTAAGAIKKLVDEFPEAGLGVCLAADGVVYLNRVHIAAALPASREPSGDVWQRPVLILVGIRLGLEGVNSMYHDSIKDLFTFPQSVGIAGGRPSSSFYFVGFQGSRLFYLDPHNQRPAVPFRHAPPSYPPSADGGEGSQEAADEWWVNAYSEQQLGSYHYSAPPKKMAMESLDPSMLLGFLCSDQSSLDDLVSRVRALSKPIFSVQDAPPRWMMDDSDVPRNGAASASNDLSYDDDLALESFSEGSMDADDDDRDGDSADETFSGSQYRDQASTSARPSSRNSLARSRSRSGSVSSSIKQRTSMARTSASQLVGDHAPTSWRGDPLSHRSSRSSLDSSSAGDRAGSSAEVSIAFPSSDDASSISPSVEAIQTSSRAANPKPHRSRVDTGATAAASPITRHHNIRHQPPSRSSPAPDVSASFSSVDTATSTSAQVAVSHVSTRPRSRRGEALKRRSSPDEFTTSEEDDANSTWEEVPSVKGNASAAINGSAKGSGMQNRQEGQEKTPRFDDSDDDF
ncbi:Cysteine protease required for autophagy-Apg4p/Aut2p [Ceraceosorus bombacis]|uniref:Autophagy-related protein 4 n=1 Tax=Ceraceosorus bombacis TaxID=401625 RepID=A0A0P1BK73_9BASI|nr:Cysteine protease required for autophagy-Apg4p/Aut2p [Ceraceosorus bombacis]